MDTVVEEKPLSFATSRMVTMGRGLAVNRTPEVFQNPGLSLHPRSLNSERALADTTAETHASVKGGDHLE